MSEAAGLRNDFDISQVRYDADDELGSSTSDSFDQSNCSTSSSDYATCEEFLLSSNVVFHRIRNMLHERAMSLRNYAESNPHNSLDVQIAIKSIEGCHVTAMQRSKLQDFLDVLLPLTLIVISLIYLFSH